MRIINIIYISTLAMTLIACAGGPKQKKTDIVENPSPIFRNSPNHTPYAQSKNDISTTASKAYKNSYSPNLNKGGFKVTMDKSSHFCQDTWDPVKKQIKTKCTQRINPHNMWSRYEDMTRAQGARPLRPSAGEKPWATSSEFLMQQAPGYRR